jgi:thioredoxin reductase
MRDVIIAGGGPAGLSAALMLGRQRRSVLVCDDGQPRNAASGAVHGFLSRDGCDPADLRSIAQDQLRTYDSVERRAVAINTVRSEGGHFVATFADGSHETSSKLVLATGLVDELPPLDGVRSMWGKSVFPCRFCDGWEVRGRSIAVLSLPENNAQRILLLIAALSRLSEDVTWCANGVPVDDFTLQILTSRKIRVRREQIAKLSGRGKQLEQIVFTEGEPLQCRSAFIEPPRRQHSDLATQLSCAFLDDGCVAVDDFGRTSVPGVYAVGDMARRTSMPFPPQVVMAAASGAAAGIGVDVELLQQTFVT